MEGEQSKKPECPYTIRLYTINQTDSVVRNFTPQNKSVISQRLHWLNHTINQKLMRLLRNYIRSKSRRTFRLGLYALYLWNARAQMSKIVSLAYVTREFRLKTSTLRFLINIHSTNMTSNGWWKVPNMTRRG